MKEQDTLKRRLEVVLLQADGAVPLPSPDDIVAGVLDIEAHLRANPIAAREALRAMLLDGIVTMDPQEDGSYLARSILTPLQLAKTGKPRNREGAGASGLETGSVSKVGCAGRI